jgi:uncharacterized membrane protein HdeD (DUF308 family)
MAFWITFIRGILAIGLGAVLLFQPDRTLPMLANFMGLYWLSSGVISLRWGAAGGRARGLALVAGAAGVLAGVAMMARWLAVAGGTVHIFVYILGTIMILTGLLHIFEGLPMGRQHRAEPRRALPRRGSRMRSLTSVLLGVFEVVLGVLLILNPQERVPGVYLSAAIWALAGGLILIGDALLLRAMRQQARPGDRRPSHHDKTPAYGERY